MKDVAAKVAEGERLPLPTDANANETETETEPPDAEASGAKLFARGVETHAAGAPKLSEVIDRCFRADPAERPTMTRVLQTLRKCAATRRRRNSTRARRRRSGEGSPPPPCRTCPRSEPRSANRRREATESVRRTNFRSG